jgi:hypothetical protein
MVSACDELACVHVGLHTLAELAPGGYGGAIHIPGVDVRDPGLFRDELCLSAFAGPRRAEDEDI